MERRHSWDMRRWRRAGRCSAYDVDGCQAVGAEEELVARCLHQPLQTRPHLARKAFCTRKETDHGPQTQHTPRATVTTVVEEYIHAAGVRRCRRAAARGGGACLQTERGLGVYTASLLSELVLGDKLLLLL